MRPLHTNIDPSAETPHRPITTETEAQHRPSVKPNRIECYAWLCRRITAEHGGTRAPTARSLSHIYLCCEAVKSRPCVLSFQGCVIVIMPLLEAFESQATNFPVVVWGSLVVALTTLCLCVYGVYNTFFHPLSAIPGPWLYASCRLPYIWCVVTGRLAVKLHQLHEKYGPIVRTASNEVSAITPEAWDIIYTRKNAFHHEFPKNYDTWNETANNFTKTLFLASKEDHPRMRKVLSPAFSDRILRDNEPVLERHVDNFLQGIGEASQASKAVDFNKWFNWLAFDAVSDFVLGESFDCLRSPEHREWLERLSMTWHFISIVSSIKSLGKTKDTFALILPRKMLQKYVDQLTLVSRTALKKLNVTPSRPTLMSIARSVPKEREDGRTKQTYLSDAEVLSNAELVVTAGTDTSATTLPATVFLLCRNPEAMRKVVAEIRAFPSEDKITAQAIRSEVPYLTACIYEALRLYAPVPEGLPRVCPSGGENICGYWIPGGVSHPIFAFAEQIQATELTLATLVADILPSQSIRCQPL